ncbi:Protein Ahnak2 [Manis pentadactyla]|nr:Protein Ahnak2 [Manis pentadactyla]
MLSWSRALLTCKTMHGQFLKVMELEVVSNEWHMRAFPVGFNLASALESWLSQGHWPRSKDVRHKLGQLETASPLVTLTGPKMDT